jgi:PAS domain S-box-containing protein
VVATNSDLTARELADAARRELKGWFSTLLETIPQMVWTTDATGQAQFQSPQIREYTGRSDEELSNGRWQRLLHRDDRAVVLALWQRMRDQEEGGEGTFRLLGGDGRYRWFLVRSVPLRGTDGRLRRWIGTLTDIHVQKESEEAKAEAIRVRDVFLSVASHELKTPVTAALLQIQHAHRTRRKADAAADLPAIAARVAASAASLERLGALVGTLLDVSRIATGKLTLERKRFDLTESVTQVAARIADSADRAGCPLEVDLAPGITAVGDRLRVEQVITSLLANAMKYGGQPDRARARAAERRRRAHRGGPRDRIAPEDQAASSSRSSERRARGTTAGSGSASGSPGRSSRRAAAPSASRPASRRLHVPRRAAARGRRRRARGVAGPRATASGTPRWVDSRDPATLTGARAYPSTSRR